MSHEHTQKPVFGTRLKTLPEVESCFDSVASAQSKKELRKRISVEYTSETLGFLHASLLEIGGESYLVAGPSGVGKSAYSNRLGAEFNSSLLAKDWVAVEKDGGSFYASDLNYSDSLRQTERSLLSGVIFLTYGDELRRDAFAPNGQEIKRLLRETFDTASDLELNKLSLFWLKNAEEFPFLSAVPARRGPENTIAKTLINLIKRKRATLNPVEVGVIGLGSIGTELAFQLGQVPYVSKVHLYNRTENKAVGYAADMNQAMADKRHDIFVSHAKPQELFASASSVFLAFRNESGGEPARHLPERWQKLPGNLHILAEHIQKIDEADFSGTLFVITNPVDVLTYALYEKMLNGKNPLRTYQVYGIGLEVDAARALYYGKQTDPSLGYDDIRLYGNHSDDFILKTLLPESDNTKLTQEVKNASKEIRKLVPRTIFGPVGAAIRSFRAFQENGSVHITTIQNDSFIGRKINFRSQLPMISEETVDGECLKIIENNRKAIARHLSG